MKTTFKNIILLLSLTTPVCAQQSIPAVTIQPGVSAELAHYRALAIKDIHYTLNFNIPAQKAEDITANEVIKFNLSADNQPLQIDFKQDEKHISSLTVNSKNAPVKIEAEHLLIGKEYLHTGENEVKISFIAGDKSLNRNDDFLYALFVPDHARTVFPCFDQPDLKAHFLLTLTVPTGWKTLANGIKKDSVINGEKTTFYFANSDKLPTYLFSFTAGKYTSVMKDIDGRNAEFLYRETDPEKIKLSVDSIFEEHRQAIRFLEGWTGIKFPFQKVGFVAIPDFQFGGMEHPGEVQYKASGVFLDDAATKDAHIARISLLSHETAHMWFGDMVTMKWFNDVWMKEVFANFMADKVTEKLMGSETFNLKFLQDHYPAAYGVDRTEGSTPIQQKLDNLQDAGSMYGNIIYHKAPIMMRQLETLMGKDDFRAGVMEYLKKYAYSNATWDDLIAILSHHTKADLYTWNKVWVHDTGRPVFDADVKYSNNQISRFVLSQHPEQGAQRIWPQSFAVTLVYADHETQLPVNMNGKSLQLNAAIGKAKPKYIIYNSNGMGYGLFPLDKSLTANSELFKLKSPLQRASAYINLYENMLDSRGYTPTELLDILETGLTKEKEETNLRLLTGYITGIYWEYISPTERNRRAGALENTLWSAMEQQAPANNKKILFGAYEGIYLTPEATQRVYNIWQSQKAPEGVKLTEDDYSGMAFLVALRSDTSKGVLQQQLLRTSNPDRKKRIIYLMPALSNDVKERDDFFYSLKERKNREKESWVLSALGYLHHPLRQSASIKYLPETLNLLEEIQATGDIFFPQSFINTTFGGYQSKEAADMVKDFITAHPHYNQRIKDKLLQGTDNLFRAQKLVAGN